MAFFTGRTGSLSVSTTAAGLGVETEEPTGGTTPVAKIRDWSLDVNVDLISTNSIDSAVNTFAPGVKGATGSATLIYYTLETGDSGVLSFKTILSRIMKEGAIEASDRMFFDLNVDKAETVNSIDDIKFWAYITSASVSVSTNELTVVPIQFTMDGDFVEVIS